MFTATEENYLKGLISVYAKQGYNYYICHTVTEINNDYDVYIYFSKKEIKAITPTTFDVTDSVFIKIDSSTRNSYNNDNGHNRALVSDVNYTGIVDVHIAEFIYTNAVANYEGNTLVINPDITLNSSSNYSYLKSSSIFIFILFIIFLYTFIADILRFRK